MADKNYYLDKEINVLLDENGCEVGKFSEAEANILAEFIEKVGKCLSRDHLVSIGWPSSIVVENSLNMAIRKFRIHGINIETIPRKGYALMDTHIMFGSRNELLRVIKKNSLEEMLEKSSQPKTEKIVEVSAQESTPSISSEVKLSSQSSSSINEENIKIVSNVNSDNHANEDEVKGIQQIIHRKRSFVSYFILFYILCLLIFYWILHSAKPEIFCFNDLDVKVCTTYDLFDKNLMKELKPGKYVYGKKFGEDVREFFKVEE
ncbi:winged helix-turn-helix domain-containing protein [Vibrio cholerae]|uniref:winged helix-turn-helix domain-containing protein n=1 Tax=Vibrio cholerae TaxID=666 RepID=UPI00155F97C7|nr:hypothetical protein [Vibrio cholerae]EJL6681033.1 hypothetical protein [Vibrio cholerae]NOF44581.1 hypothetical protein [Vibrio cholerae]NOF55115.1 hypothetical protein [Vibrio cholerae]